MLSHPTGAQECVVCKQPTTTHQARVSTDFTTSVHLHERCQDLFQRCVEEMAAFGFSAYHARLVLEAGLGIGGAEDHEDWCRACSSMHDHTCKTSTVQHVFCAINSRRLAAHQPGRSVAQCKGEAKLNWLRCKFVADLEFRRLMYLHHQHQQQQALRQRRQHEVDPVLPPLSQPEHHGTDADVDAVEEPCTPDQGCAGPHRPNRRTKRSLSLRLQAEDKGSPSCRQGEDAETTDTRLLLHGRDPWLPPSVSGPAGGVEASAQELGGVNGGALGRRVHTCERSELVTLDNGLLMPRSWLESSGLDIGKHASEGGSDMACSIAEVVTTPSDAQSHSRPLVQPQAAPPSFCAPEVDSQPKKLFV